MIQLRLSWRWAILGLILIGGLVPLSFVFGCLLNLQSISDLSLPASGLKLIGLVVFKLIYQFFFFNAIGEEVGWRGFALPRLQAKTSPLIAAFIIALFWAPWHFFLWQAEGSPVLTCLHWLVRYAGTIIVSVLIVWIYNRSKGSIFVAGIAHAAWNTACAFISIKDGLILYPTGFVAMLVVILTDRMWIKLPPEHPTVYRLSPSNA